MRGKGGTAQEIMVAHFILQTIAAWFSFSEFWVELLNAKGWVVYQIEAIKKLYLVYKFQDFN